MCWVLFTAAILIGVAAAISLQWKLSYSFADKLVLIDGGAIRYVDFRAPFRVHEFSISSSQSAWEYGGWRPRYADHAEFFSLSIPLWMLFVLFGIPGLVLFYCGRRRLAPGKYRCGYDLTENASSIRPECGQSVEPRT